MLYKVLGENGEALHGGKGQWNLPQDGESGEWMPYVDRLEMCASGYHLVERGALVRWIGPTIYEAEADQEGELIEDGKHCVHTARLTHRLEGWNEQTARLFACDCAEHVVYLYERDYPDDTRPREAIAVARRYAHGEATVKELAAAGEAAWAAAWDAAWDAAWAAAGDAAGAAERRWQARRLMAYLTGRVRVED